MENGSRSHIDNIKVVVEIVYPSINSTRNVRSSMRIRVITVSNFHSFKGHALSCINVVYHSLAIRKRYPVVVHRPRRNENPQIVRPIIVRVSINSYHTLHKRNRENHNAKQTNQLYFPFHFITTHRKRVSSSRSSSS